MYYFYMADGGQLRGDKMANQILELIGAGDEINYTVSDWSVTQSPRYTTVRRNRETLNLPKVRYTLSNEAGKVEFLRDFQRAYNIYHACLCIADALTVESEPCERFGPDDRLQSIAEGDAFVSVVPDPTCIDGTVTVCNICEYDISAHGEECPWGYIESLGLKDDGRPRRPGWCRA